MRRLVIGSIAAVVLLTLFIVLCTYVRRPYERVLLYRFGRLVDQDSQVHLMYNWYLKLPTDSVVPIDTRLHLHPGPLQQVAILGNESINIRAFAAWRIKDPIKFYQTTGGNDKRAEEIMDGKIRGLVAAKLSKHSLDDIFNQDQAKVQTAQIEREIAIEATQGSTDPETKTTIAGLQDQGIEIVEVGFSRMAFPPQNASFVYNRMVAELNRQAKAFESDGQAQAARIRAEGLADAAKIRSESAAEAQRIQGEADAQALKIRNDVISSAAAQDFYQFYKRLDFLKTTFKKNTWFVIESNSAFLKDLMEPPALSSGGSTTRPGSPQPLVNPLEGVKTPNPGK